MKSRQILAAALAAGVLGATSCEYVKAHKTAQGALIGTAAGAGAGALIGEVSGGHAGRGAAWGAAGGALVGTGIGYYLERQQNDIQERVPNAQVSQETYTNPQYAPQGTRALNIRMENQVLFDFDSDRLHPAARQSLAQLAAVLTDTRYPPPKRIIIVGHTDSTGSRQYNKELSQRRAEAVSDYLVSRGVDRSLLAAVGMGPDEPVADNSTESGRARNRRVEIHILPAE